MKAEAFGFKNAWIAVRTDDPAAVAKALSLRNVRTADWSSGIAAAYEYPIGCSVFVTPPIDGWVLCVGFPMFTAVDARPPTFLGQAAAWAGSLGCEVQYFYTHRVVETHAWARALPTGPDRAYAFSGESGETLLDEGISTTEERELGFAFFDPASPLAEAEGYWERDDLVYPSEQHVMALAGRWSVDPSSLDDRTMDVANGIIGDFGEPPTRQSPVVEPPSRPWWKVW